MKLIGSTRIVAGIAGVLMAAGCGGGAKTGGGKVSVNLTNLALSASSATSSLVEWLSPGSINYAGTFSTADQLLSLKYIFQNVSLCQSVEATQAFGFGTTSGCTGLYGNFKQVPGDLDATVDQILSTYSAATDAFDLTSSADLARLNASSATATAGDYNFVLVNWASAIGVKGSVTVGSTTLNTHAQTSVATSGGGAPVSTVPSMTAGTPDLTYVKSANGGSVFKFQKSLTVSASKSYLLDIIFNPKAVLTGCVNGTAGNITDGTNSINMPMLPVTGVLREVGDKIVRESYPITTSSAAYVLGIDLYYLKSDASQTVLAATVTGYPNTTDASCYAPDVRVFQVTAAADGSLTFVWSTDPALDGTILTGMKRGASAAGTTITFGGGMNGRPLGVDTGTVGTMVQTEF